MRRNRLLIFVVPLLLAIAGGWTAWWYGFAATIPGAMQAWASDQRARGYEVAWDGIAVSGFPGDFVIAVEAPRMTREADGIAWTWQGGGLVAMAGPLDLSTVTWEVTGGSDLEWRSPEAPGGVRATAESVRGVVRIDAGGRPGSGRAELAVVRVLDQVTGDLTTADRFDIEGRHVAPDRGGSPDGSLDISWRLVGLDLPENGPTALGRRIDLFEGSTTITAIGAGLEGNDDPRAAITDWRARDGLIIVHLLRLDWGPLVMLAEGVVGLDAGMRPEGRLETTTRGYRETAAALVDAGVLDRDEAAGAVIVLDMVSASGGVNGERVLELPLRAREGELWVGIVRVGELPPLVLPGE